MRGKTSKLGDTRIAPNGYHYTRTENGWELTHRLIAEEGLGRCLGPNEMVRFADKDRTNFDPKNIIVIQTRKATKRARLARLRARRMELDHEINVLERELEN